MTDDEARRIATLSEAEAKAEVDRRREHAAREYATTRMVCQCVNATVVCDAIGCHCPVCGLPSRPLPSSPTATAPSPTAEKESYIKLPTSAAEAQMMQKVGYAYISEHAPHRLTKLAQDNREAVIRQCAAIAGAHSAINGADYCSLSQFTDCCAESIAADISDAIFAGIMALLEIPESNNVDPPARDGLTEVEATAANDALSATKMQGGKRWRQIV